VKPKVTVVIPTINRASLATALNSVIGQTFQDYEVVIVDDSREQLVESSRFKVIRTGGLAGVSKARNLGISEVSTEFTALLDDDDQWHKEYLEKQLMNFAQLDIDFGITGAVVNGRNRPKTPLGIGANPFELLYGKPHILRSKAYLPTSAYLFRTIMAEKIKFNESISDRENLNFVWDAFRQNYRIHQDPLSLVTINYSSKNSLSRINVAEEKNWSEYLENFDESWCENFLLESIRNFIRNGDRISAKILLEQLNPEIKSLQKIVLKLVAH
jgi:glycosyltransferase involved in cell wall biosynthesis